MPPTKTEPAQRFWAKVDNTESCWNWTGGKSGNGYGYFRNGEMFLAHRWAYENLVGPIPDGMQLDHTCRNTLCVNPSHLRPVTNKQNQENLGVRRGSSGVRGVSWYKRDKVWQVKVTHHYRQYYGGNYLTVEEAERAAIELRNKLYTHNIEK